MSLNGLRPVASSQIATPYDQTSLANVYVPSSASGAVHLTGPSCVNVVLPSFSLRANPKSLTFSTRGYEAHFPRFSDE